VTETEDYEGLRKEADRLLRESNEEQVETVSREIRERPRPKTILREIEENVESVEIRKPTVGTFHACLKCGKELLRRPAFIAKQLCIRCRLKEE
jgi:hypothetical protein